MSCASLQCINVFFLISTVGHYPNLFFCHSASYQFAWQLLNEAQAGSKALDLLVFFSISGCADFNHKCAYFSLTAIKKYFSLLFKCLCLITSLFVSQTTERRHSSTSKQSTIPPFPVSGKSRSSSGGHGPVLGSGAGVGVTSASILSRASTASSSVSLSSSSSSSSSLKLVKSAKDKLPGVQRRPPIAPFRMLHPDKMYVFSLHHL